MLIANLPILFEKNKVLRKINIDFLICKTKKKK